MTVEVGSPSGMISGVSPGRGQSLTNIKESDTLEGLLICLIIFIKILKDTLSLSHFVIQKPRINTFYSFCE